MQILSAGSYLYMKMHSMQESASKQLMQFAMQGLHSWESKKKLWEHRLQELLEVQLAQFAVTRLQLKHALLSKTKFEAHLQHLLKSQESHPAPQYLQ